MRRTPVLSAILAAALAGSVAATGVVATGAAAPAPVTAKITGFGPKVVTVKRGAVVRWRNADRQDHNAVALTKIRGRSAFTSGAATTRHFRAEAPARPGRYRYVCAVHPLTMRGVLVVR